MISLRGILDDEKERVRNLFTQNESAHFALGQSSIAIRSQETTYVTYMTQNVTFICYPCVTTISVHPFAQLTFFHSH